MTRHAATATEPDRDGTGLYPHETPARYDPHVRDAWSRLGKPPTYAQAWLSAAVLAALVGAAFSAVGILAGWQLPWPQFAVLMPAWYLVLIGLRSSYDIHRRRASSQGR